MTVRLRNGAIFLHVPKTGGTWVEHVLAGLDLVAARFGHEHADFDRVLNRQRLLPAGRLCGALLQRRLAQALGRRPPPEPPKFCFVRHPLRWYESWWRYMQGRGWNHWGQVNSPAHWHPNSALNGLGSDDFNRFVMNVIRHRPGYVSELYYAYTKPGIDYIGRTESLSRDLGRILRALGCEVSDAAVSAFERQNVSPRGGADLVWDADVRAAALAVELPALLHFGYAEGADLAPDSLLATVGTHPALLPGSGPRP